jgi:hypothetical protein
VGGYERGSAGGREGCEARRRPEPIACLLALGSSGSDGQTRTQIHACVLTHNRARSCQAWARHNHLNEASKGTLYDARPAEPNPTPYPAANEQWAT